MLLLHEKSQRFRNGFAAIIIIINQSAQSKDERCKRARVVGRRKCAAAWALTLRRTQIAAKKHLTECRWRAQNRKDIDGHQDPGSNGVQRISCFMAYVLSFKVPTSVFREFLELGILVQALSRKRRLSGHHILSNGHQFLWFSVLYFEPPDSLLVSYKKLYCEHLIWREDRLFLLLKISLVLVCCADCMELLLFSQGDKNWLVR